MACSNRQTSQKRAVSEMGCRWLCDDVVVYIEGYYFGFIEILRIRGLSMFRFDLLQSHIAKWVFRYQSALKTHRCNAL